MCWPPGPWDDAREETAEKLINKITEYAPNFRDSVIDWRLITPEDMESRVGLTNGNIHHLDLVDSQMLSNRPLPGWSDYRTPIEGYISAGPVLIRVERSRGRRGTMLPTRL